MRKFSFIVLFLAVILEANPPLHSYVVKRESYKPYDVGAHVKLKKKRGDYALASVFGDTKEIAWARRFRIVELGNVENPDVSYGLLEKRALLDIEYPIAYDWMPALYYYTDGKNRDFVKWLYKNRKTTTLNPEGPFIHCKVNHYDWCQDYYYNLANRELLQKRVNDVVTNMNRRGFRGLFFDWGAGNYIDEKRYKPMLENFKKLHTGKNYFDFVRNFYKRLKELDIFVVTNQGFRKAEYVLPFVQYDMTESYITTDAHKKMDIQLASKGWVNSVVVTNYYPIYKDSKDLKDSLKYIDMLSRYKEKYKKFGFKKFIYLNYLAPAYKKMYASAMLYEEVKPKNGIYFSYAMAKLADNIVYAEISQNRELERDEIYFYDLGKVLGTKYEKLDGINGYIRFYENGFVLVSEPYNKEIYLHINAKYLNKKRKIYDAYENKELHPSLNGVVVDLKFEKDSLSSDYLPLGRVYLYF